MREVKSLMRCVIIQVISTHMHRVDAMENMIEVERLVQTLGGVVVCKEIQHRVHPHPDMYLGQGKVDWLKRLVSKKKVDLVEYKAIKPRLKEKILSEERRIYG